MVCYALDMVGTCSGGLGGNVWEVAEVMLGGGSDDFEDMSGSKRPIETPMQKHPHTYSVW